MKFGRTQYTTTTTAGHFQNYLFTYKKHFFLNEFKRTCQITITEINAQFFAICFQKYIRLYQNVSPI